jgi:hypothetical protein
VRHHRESLIRIGLSLGIAVAMGGCWPRITDADPPVGISNCSLRLVTKSGNISARYSMRISNIGRVTVRAVRVGFQEWRHPSVPITSLSSSVAVYDDDGRLVPGQSRVIALETSSLNAVMPRPSPGQHFLSCVVLSALLANGHGWQNDGIRCRDGEYGKCLVLPSAPRP